MNFTALVFNHRLSLPSGTLSTTACVSSFYPNSAFFLLFFYENDGYPIQLGICFCCHEKETITPPEYIIAQILYWLIDHEKCSVRNNHSLQKASIFRDIINKWSYLPQVSCTCMALLLWLAGKRRSDYTTNLTKFLISIKPGEVRTKHSIRGFGGGDGGGGGELEVEVGGDGGVGGKVEGGGFGEVTFSRFVMKPLLLSDTWPKYDRTQTNL